MLRLDWLSQEVLGDVDEMTPSRQRDYLIKYPNLCLLDEMVMDWVDVFVPRAKLPCPNVGVAALAE